MDIKTPPLKEFARDMRLRGVFSTKEILGENNRPWHHLFEEVLRAILALAYVGRAEIASVRRHHDSNNTRLPQVTRIVKSTRGLLGDDQLVSNIYIPGMLSKR